MVMKEGQVSLGFLSLLWCGGGGYDGDSDVVLFTSWCGVYHYAVVL